VTREEYRALFPPTVYAHSLQRGRPRDAKPPRRPDGTYYPTRCDSCRVVRYADQVPGGLRICGYCAARRRHAATTGSGGSGWSGSTAALDSRGGHPRHGRRTPVGPGNRPSQQDHSGLPACGRQAGIGETLSTRSRTGRCGVYRENTNPVCRPAVRSPRAGPRVGSGWWIVRSG
jgi:hypothetical protein